MFSCLLFSLSRPTQVGRKRKATKDGLCQNTPSAARQLNRVRLGLWLNLSDTLYSLHPYLLRRMLLEMNEFVLDKAVRTLIA